MSRRQIHLVIPDTQVKPGVNTDHLEHLGKYIAHYKPNTVIHLGDHWDMPSLSSYDKNKKASENTRYQKDIDAGKLALDRMLHQMKGMKKKPRLVALTGNHEERINRMVNDNKELEGKLGLKDLGREDMGFETYDFLEVCEIDGIAYSHFFPRGPRGKISQTKNGAPSAAAMLSREGGSCTAGHTQGLDVACAPLRRKLQWGLIAGSFYSHDEQYLSPQGTPHWRGVIVKHEVQDGSYCPMFVSLSYLRRKFGEAK